MRTHETPVGDDDETVVAVHHEAGSDDWLVFCHGLLSDKSGSYERRCRRAVEEGYNAIRFDFRGCGDSEGEFADATLGARLADLRAVVDYFDLESYVVFGSSFGGKVALYAAARDDRVDAVATRAPVTYNATFDEYRQAVASEGVLEFDTSERIDSRFFEALDEYRFDGAAEQIDVPVAIFHGRRDDSVDVDYSVDAARRLETDVLLQSYADEGHRFSAAAEDRLLEQLFDWLALL